MEGVPGDPVPAATVVLLRPGPDGPEVLLTHRPTTMAFAADLHVFPGGRVDPGDADPRLAGRSALSPDGAAAALGGNLSPAAGHAAFVAAIREVLEEAGVAARRRGSTGGRPRGGAARPPRGETGMAQVADDLDLRLRTDLLVPIGHWTTPPIMPRRFDTWFFAAELPAGAEPTFAADEVLSGRWLTPTAALESMANGDIAMWPPTAATLQQLAHAAGLTEVRERIVLRRASPPRVVVERPGLTRIVVGEAGGVPGQSVNTYLVGHQAFVLVDPGDPSDAAADEILVAAAEARGRIVAIAVTSAEPDHAAGAEGLALRLEVPIHAGPGAGRFLPYDVIELRGGETLDGPDVVVEVVSTPGPRPDGLAFAVDGDLFVGDLVGGTAEQALPGPADEPARRVALHALAARRPRRVYPAHGEPLGPAALSVGE